MALEHAAPGEIVDFAPYGPRIRQQQTSAIVKAELFEVVRLVVLEGNEIRTHVVDGPIMLECLEGRTAIGLSGGTVELAAGQWMHLQGGEPHSVRGVEDSSLLLTILFPNGRRGGATV